MLIFKGEKNFLFLVMLIVLTISCQKNNIPQGIEQKHIMSDVHPEAMLYNEVANLIGESPNGQSAYKLASMIQNADNSFETLSIEEICNPVVKSEESTDLLSELLYNLNKKADKFPTIAKQIKRTKSNDFSITDLRQLDVELYMPESDNFDLEVISHITITYDPIVRNDYSDGYRYDLKTGKKEFIPVVDEQYLEKNPTIIVLPKDHTIYSEPVEVVPDGILNQNITNSESIREQDVLYTTVQSIRANASAKSWCGAISNKLKLAIYRASGDVEFLDNGELKASGHCHKPILMAISKKDIKKSRWHDNVNYLFDDDWDLHEYDQKIFFASEHNTGKPSASVNTNVGIGYKNGKFSAELGFSVNAKVDFANHSKMREHNELTRSAVLATNVDMPNSHNGFTVRSYGPIDIVFNFHYTRLN